MVLSTLLNPQFWPWNWMNDDHSQQAPAQQQQQSLQPSPDCPSVEQLQATHLAVRWAVWDAGGECACELPSSQCGDRGPNAVPCCVHHASRSCDTHVSTHFTPDGFGAHYGALMRIYAYAKQEGLKYCSTPWGREVPGEKTMNTDGLHPEMRGQEKAKALWEFIGGGLLGPDCDAVSGATCGVVRPSIEELAAGTIRWGAYLDAATELRRFYDSTARPKLSMFAGGGTRTLAVHVRRGDVVDNPKYREGGSEAWRWVSDAQVRECIDRTLQKIGGADGSVVVHIFSEGAANTTSPELRTIAGATPVLHLNSELKDTFHHLVAADAFVMGPSSLSNMAAWLRLGKAAGDVSRANVFDGCACAGSPLSWCEAREAS